MAGFIVFMKKILFILLFVICSTTVSAQDNSGNIPVLSITKGKVLEKDGDVFWEIPVTLTNTAKDTLHYASMSCSWPNFYTVNSKKLFNPGVGCDKNFPIAISLPPSQSNTVILMLTDKRKNSTKPLKFKIGFDLFILKNKDSALDLFFRDNNSENNILWSNEINML